MSGTGLSSALAVLALGLFLPTTASAQTAPSSPSIGPALANVQEIIIRPARLSGRGPAERCLPGAGDVQDYLLKFLQGDGLPVFSMVGAPAPSPDTARIELVPEIVTVSAQGFECTSWIALTAQTRNHLRIPPIEASRSVHVIYWRAGLLVTSGVTGHPGSLEQAFSRLAEQFSRQYKIDQPPSLRQLGLE